jgi:hypothetical protein
MDAVSRTRDVAFAGVFGGQLLNIVADLQFDLGPTFGGSDVLQGCPWNRSL